MKNYSENEWNSFYIENEVVVPYLDVCVFAVKKIKNIQRSRDQDIKIYEFGVGMGNNIKFIHQLFPDVTLYGSDISKEAIQKLNRENIPNSKFWVNDFQLNMQVDELDLVIERGSLQHVSKDQSKAYIYEIYQSMKIGAEGYFEIASTSHGLYKELGELGLDPKLGLRTFYSLEEIHNLFSEFKIQKIFHLTRELLVDDLEDKNVFNTYTQGSWQVEVKKFS